MKYRGKPLADVWFKPEEAPFELKFRIPRQSLEIPGIGQQLTAQNLLKAVGIEGKDVDALQVEGGAAPVNLQAPLPVSAGGRSHLILHVHLKAQSQTPSDKGDTEMPEAKWQEIEARWNAILVLEANMETLRISMDGLRGELEAAARRTLSGDDKFYGSNADVAQWTKAKNRIVFASPKAREFVHRSTWAVGTPERKRLEDLFKNHVKPRIPFPELDEMADQLENVLKDRQVLTAHGVAVYQECKGIAAEVHAALRTLQRNAAAKALKKRTATGLKGKR